MDPIALGFVALAAVLHAGWNILLKAAGDPLRTAAVGIAAASAVLVPVVAIGWFVLGQPRSRRTAWAIGILSGGVEVLYFAFLAAAFRRGDLSVVYPLARGSAPLLAIAIGVTCSASGCRPALAGRRAAPRRPAVRPAAVAAAPVRGERERPIRGRLRPADRRDDRDATRRSTGSGSS